MRTDVHRWFDDMYVNLRQNLIRIHSQSILFLMKFDIILVVDITNGAARTITSLVFEFFWSIGLIILPVFNLFIEDWWKLYIAISMPTICLIFLMK